MLRILPLLFFTLCFSYIGVSQEDLSWKKHRKLAEQLYASGQYVEAAKNFEKAWNKHPQSEELIYKAGECYFLLKDFKNASLAYKYVKEQNDKFELVGLKYARSLKQDGQYEAAKRELVYFLTAYQGPDKEIVTQIVNTEIKGCDLGIKLSQSSRNPTLEVRHLDEKINSLYTEFAPIPFAEDLMYFSSTKQDNKAYLFRSQKQKGVWSKAVAAENLPDLPNKHLANGSFAPDASRFYFTLCDASSTGNGLTSVCEINVIKRMQSSWSAPIRLRAYINEEGATTTQPWVVHKAGKEILYFASNRKGGKGGMDIWYATRDINSGDIDFTYPVNLGKQINTMGDEITPFYDNQEGILYFSSNGLTSLGGWDIFKAQGEAQNWAQPENLGLPINSSADDFYYVLKPSRKSGFLVSNRSAGPEKVSTQHEDIFEFGATTQKQQPLYVKGQVLDKANTADINNTTVSLYEVMGKTIQLLQTKRITANDYQFPVLPNKNFRLIVEKQGYLKNSYDFSSAMSDKAINHDFYLSTATPTSTEPPVASTNSSASYSASTTISERGVATTSPASVIRTTTPVPTATNNQRSTDISATPDGIYYKVQLIAVSYHNENHPRYRHVKSLANLETESVPEKGVTRVLLANFSSKDKARAIMQQAQYYGFADAFMVKYKGGKRLGTVWQ